MLKLLSFLLLLLVVSCGGILDADPQPGGGGGGDGHQEQRVRVEVVEEELPAYIAYNRANDLGRSGHAVSEVIAAYVAALELKWSLGEAHMNVANLYMESGHIVEAVQHHWSSVTYARTEVFRADALCNLAVALLRFPTRTRELAAAAAASTRLPSSDIERSMYHRNTRDLSFDLEPRALLLAALGADSRNTCALNMLAAMHTDEREFEDALRYLTLAVSAHPTNPVVLMNMGNHFAHHGHFDEALPWYHRALAAALGDGGPPAVEAGDLFLLYNNLGHSLRETGQPEAAIEAYWKAKSIGKSSLDKSQELWVTNNIIAVQGISSNWSHLEALESDLVQGIKSLYVHRKNVEEHRPAHVDLYTFSLQRFVDPQTDLALATSPAGRCQAIKTFASDRSNSRFNITKRAEIIRLGYLSYDWRDHPMGRLTSYLVTSHNSSLFEVFCFYYGPQDACDDVNRELGSCYHEHFTENCKYFVYMAQATHTEAIAALRGFDLDVLVDLTAHTTGGRIELAASHPARVVFNYLGYPGTTGCAGFDYNLVDHKVVPADYLSRSFSEKLVYLPLPYQANNMPAMPLCLCTSPDGPRTLHVENDMYPVCCKHSIISDASNAVPLFGSHEIWNRLRESANLLWLCALNSNKKFEPISFQTWSNILYRIPRSLLLVLEPESGGRRNLDAEAAARGLTGRMIYIPKAIWKKHVFRSSVCDIALDNFVYGAHTTASDVLWAGVPLVSLEGWGESHGGRMPSRVASSLITSLDFHDFNRNTDGAVESEMSRFDGGNVIYEKREKLSDITIVNSPRELEDVLIRLLSNPASLRLLKSKIWMQARSPEASAFNRTERQRYVEAAYEAAFDMYDAHRVPMHIVVGSQRWVESSIKIRERLEYNNAHFTATSTLSSSCEEIQLPEFVECINLDFLSIRTCLEHLVHPCFEKRNGSSIEVPLRSVLKLQELLTGGQYSAQEREQLCRLESVLFEVISSHVLQSVEIESSTSAVGCLDMFHQNILDIFNLESDEAYYELRAAIAGIFPCEALQGASVLSLQRRWFLDVPEVGYGAGTLIHNHVSCAIRTAYDISRVFSTARASLSSVLLAPSDDAHRELMLGTVLSSLGFIDSGFKTSSVAVIHQNQIDNDNYLRTYGILDATVVDKPRVVIYCNEYGNAWFPNWGHHSMASGAVGGSEEAAIVIAIKLGAMGFHVELYSDPSPENSRLESNGIIWRSYRDYDPAAVPPPDIFIAWRYAVSLGLCPSVIKNLGFYSGSDSGKTTCILWLQDLVTSDVLPPVMLELADAFRSRFFVAVPSVFHRDAHLPAHLAPFARVMMNGIDSALVSEAAAIVKDTARSRNRSLVVDLCKVRRTLTLIYASAPNRGLEQVLDMWPLIREAHPDAILQVFYGFSESKTAQMQRMMGLSEAQFKTWRDELLTRMATVPGIEYHGEVRPSDLLQYMHLAGFILYPTRFPETGCISIMKAMASGCIPITSRYMSSVLRAATPGATALHYSASNASFSIGNRGDSITSVFDMGPGVPYSDDLDYPTWIRSQWLPSVLEALQKSKTTEEKLPDQDPCYKSDPLFHFRTRMIEYAKREFSWDTSAQVLVDIAGLREPPTNSSCL